jgi:hypothetical protein
MERWFAVYGVAIGSRLALHSFLKILLYKDLLNFPFAFLKGLGFLQREAVTALIDSHVIDGLALD